jgi:hypothetical protein
MAFWTLVLAWLALSFWPDARGIVGLFGDLGRLAVASLDAARTDSLSIGAFLGIVGLVMPAILHPSWALWRQMREL